MFNNMKTKMFLLALLSFASLGAYCQTQVPSDDLNSPIYYLGEDVGIGTNSPNALLDVNGSINVGNMLL